MHRCSQFLELSGARVLLRLQRRFVWEADLWAQKPAVRARFAESQTRQHVGVLPSSGYG